METDERFFVGIKALIKNKDNKIMVLKSGPLELKSTKRKTPFWDLPGGKIRIGEKDVEHTLRREVSEELGVRQDSLIIGRLFDASISKIKMQHGRRIPLVLVTFLCKLSESDFRLTGEHDAAGWVSVKKAKTLLGTKFSNSFIKKLEDGF